MKFSEMNLAEFLVKALDKNGVTTPTEVQAKTIPAVMEKKDLIVKSKTGSGKTFSFALPTLNATEVDEKFTQVLVICPTRELAMQVTGEYRKLTEFKEGLKVVPIVGGSAMERQITALKSGAKIVVGTPGRLNDHIRRRTLKLANVKTVVLDEADEMMEMGFKEEIDTILSKANPYRQTIMYSATMPESVRKIAEKFMKNPEFFEIDKTDENSSIKQYFVFVGLKDKERALTDLYLSLKPQSAIIFCNTKKMADLLYNKLTANKIASVKIHGDMPQTERKRVMDAIKSGASRLLIATDVAARGIDIPSVEVVFNYDLPEKSEWYVHRVGRTGRAGKQGSSYSIINTPHGLEVLYKIEQETGNRVKEYIVPRSKTRPDKKRVVNKKPSKSNYPKNSTFSFKDDKKGKRGEKPFKYGEKPFKKGGEKSFKSEKPFKHGKKETFNKVKKSTPFGRKFKKSK
ncbi:MAG: DEAD/DEAH box helicase [Clostridia bacterium]|nr:DEAD/DEAH box helicase [Clostridia bacterium]